MFVPGGRFAKPYSKYYGADPDAHCLVCGAVSALSLPADALKPDQDTFIASLSEDV